MGNEHFFPTRRSSVLVRLSSEVASLTCSVKLPSEFAMSAVPFCARFDRPLILTEKDTRLASTHRCTRYACLFKLIVKEIVTTPLIAADGSAKVGIPAR